MRATEFVTEVTIDNRNGWGAVPLNAEVDYRGIAVQMKPSVFLKLALPVAQHDRDVTNIAAHIEAGGGIGAPFLHIEIPDEWRNDGDTSAPAQVIGHDGRHRMMAIYKTEGDHPVEVHLFPISRRSEWRNRHLTPDILQALNANLIPQGRGRSALQGPFFSI